MMEQQQEDDKGEKITTKDDSIQSNNPNIISSNLATDRKKKIQKKKGIKKLKSSTTETMKTYHTLGFGSNYFHLFGQDAIPITDEYYHDKDDHDEGDFEKEEQQQNLKQRPSSAYMFQSLPPGCTGVPYSNSANSNVTNRTSKNKKKGKNNRSALVKGSHIFTTLKRPSFGNDKKKGNKDSTSKLQPENTLTTTATISSLSKEEEEVSSEADTTTTTSTYNNNIIKPLPYGTNFLPSSTATLPSTVTCGSTHTTTLLSPFSSSTSSNISVLGTIRGKIRTKPMLISTKLPLKITQVASGRRHVLALLEGGVVTMSWGAGHFGQLGHGGEIVGCDEPKIIERLLPQMLGGRVIHIAAGGLHSGAIIESSSSSTRTFCWGSNRRGQCGIEGGKCHTVPYPTPIVDVYHPEKTSTLVSFTSLSLGRLHSVALTAAGEVYTWGSNTMGRCGHGHNDYPQNSSNPNQQAQPKRSRYHIYLPQRVQALRNVKSTMISAGDGHTLVLSGSGRVFSFGCGSEGQLGQGHTMHLLSPRLVSDLDFNGVVAAMLAGLKNGDEGGHEGGEVVTGPTLPSSPTSSSSPPSTPTILAPKIVSVHASGSYSAAVSSSGDLYTWGYGDPNQLGHPYPSSSPSSNEAQLPYMEVGAGGGGNKRVRDSQSFDSRLNVLVPRRVECTRDLGLRVEDVSLGPSHMVLLCSVREEEEEVTDTDENDGQEEGEEMVEEQEKVENQRTVVDPIGITLYEAELMRDKKKKILRTRAAPPQKAVVDAEENHSESQSNNHDRADKVTSAPQQSPLTSNAVAQDATAGHIENDVSSTNIDSKLIFETSSPTEEVACSQQVPPQQTSSFQTEITKEIAVATADVPTAMDHEGEASVSTPEPAAVASEMATDKQMNNMSTRSSSPELTWVKIPPTYSPERRKSVEENIQFPNVSAKIRAMESPDGKKRTITTQKIEGEDEVLVKTTSAPMKKTEQQRPLVDESHQMKQIQETKELTKPPDDVSTGAQPSEPSNLKSPHLPDTKEPSHLPDTKEPSHLPDAKEPSHLPNPEKTSNQSNPENPPKKNNSENSSKLPNPETPSNQPSNELRVSQSSTSTIKSSMSTSIAESKPSSKKGWKKVASKIKRSLSVSRSLSVRRSRSSTLG